MKVARVFYMNMNMVLTGEHDVVLGRRWGGVAYGRSLSRLSGQTVCSSPPRSERAEFERKDLKVTAATKEINEIHNLI